MTRKIRNLSAVCRVLLVMALVETLPAAAVAEMTAGEYPLSLFTCDYSGQARITVRCTRAGDAP